MNKVSSVTSLLQTRLSRRPLRSRLSHRDASLCHFHTSSSLAPDVYDGFNSSSASRCRSETSNPVASSRCHSCCELHHISRSQHVPNVSGPESTKLSLHIFKCIRVRFARGQIVQRMCRFLNGLSSMHPSTREAPAHEASLSFPSLQHKISTSVEDRARI